MTISPTRLISLTIVLVVPVNVFRKMLNAVVGVLVVGVLVSKLKLLFF